MSQAAQCADGVAIVGGDQRGRGHWEGEHLLGRLLGEFDVPAVAAHVLFVDMQPGVLHRGRIAAIAFRAGPQRQRQSEKTDAGVPSGDELLAGLVRAVEIVDEHAVDLDAAGWGGGQHHGRAIELVRREVAVVVAGGYDDQSGDPASGHVEDELPLAVHVCVRAGNDDTDTVFGGHFLHADRELGVERVRQVGDDQPDQLVRRAGTQLPRQVVAAVAESGDLGEYAFSRRLGDAAVAAKGPGYGHRADPEPLRDVAHRHRGRSLRFGVRHIPVTFAFTTRAGLPPRPRTSYGPTEAGTTMVSAYPSSCSSPFSVTSITRSPSTTFSTWNRPFVSCGALAPGSTCSLRTSKNISGSCPMSSSCQPLPAATRRGCWTRLSATAAPARSGSRL